MNAWSQGAARRRNEGVSLVEIMVGMVIGMLAAIVILQMLALSEERKRTTTSAGESQSDGIIAFYQIQRDIGQAGYGFAAKELLGCAATWTVSVGGAAIGTAIPLAPATINPKSGAVPPADLIPPGDPNSDTLLVIYGNPGNEPQGNVINLQPAATQYSLQMATAFSVNDRVIALPPAGCAAPPVTLDRVTALTTPTVTVTTGAAGVVNGTLYNLGRTPSVLAYAVRGGNLTVCDFMANDCGATANKANPAIWQPVASGIVSIKAQYVRDTATAAPTAAIPPTYAKSDSYDQTTPSGVSAACNWTRVIALRLALVSRSNQIDNDPNLINAINQNAPAWDGSATDAIDVSKNPDGTTNADWKKYRYKVFQSVVPMRNIAWMGVPVGC